LTFVCEFFLCGLRHGFCSLDCQHFFFVELRGERPASCILTACSETHPKKTTSADISNQKLLLASADSARLRGSCSDFLHAGAHSMMHVTIFAYATFPTIDLCRAFHAPSMSCVCCVLLARARSGKGALAQSLHTPHDHDRTLGWLRALLWRAAAKGLWRSRRRLRAHLGRAVVEPDTAARHPKLALEYHFLSFSGPGFPSRQILLLFAERSPAHRKRRKTLPKQRFATNRRMDARRAKALIR